MLLGLELSRLSNHKAQVNRAEQSLYVMAIPLTPFWNLQTLHRLELRRLRFRGDNKISLGSRPRPCVGFTHESDFIDLEPDVLQQVRNHGD